MLAAWWYVFVGWSYHNLIFETKKLQNYAQILEIILRLRQICAHAALCPKEVLQGALDAVAAREEEASLLANRQDAIRNLYLVFKDSGLDQCMACSAEFTDEDDEEPVTPMITACRHLYVHYSVGNGVSLMVSCGSWCFFVCWFIGYAMDVERNPRSRVLSARGHFKAAFTRSR